MQSKFLLLSILSFHLKYILKNKSKYKVLHDLYQLVKFHFDYLWIRFWWKITYFCTPRLSMEGVSSWQDHILEKNNMKCNIHMVILKLGQKKNTKKLFLLEFKLNPATPLRPLWTQAAFLTDYE